ncbi:MAG: glycosyltransferase family 2 protein [Candidatus Omnitrophica bacterium]|nr:glycosyltransferase family 2 protein [Candidatus Omnitrophota bacterium]MDD4940956.1 glycosyltransferase family 2 protein [Candidatus Omnitrophota bacterium]MDD5774633.1 glycosyltransferase family 2 protein [Candidatus Omnitrophota bacterium]HNQ50626.1 glycosyltransferase family 2 protein [Candidatus Omnitrophota bacterium]HQO37668.1 glycosyltransferase family 2 protein [Candidatus Omnitrophota bacterium]
MSVPTSSGTGAHTSLLSVLVPACNESGNIPRLVAGIEAVLEREAIPYEILIVNDHSRDETLRAAGQEARRNPRIRLVDNNGRSGYGFAVRKGLEHFKGDMVVIAMADASDSPEDMAAYYRKMEEGFDCVFGNRFCPQARVLNYPFHKLVFNRIANFFIRVLFRIHYADVTNAFKCYSRQAVRGMQPLIACHFNLTVEMPLKAIIRGYRWTVIPTHWTGRKQGMSKWKIKEMGSRYMFIIIYLWLEKTLSRGDYHRSLNENTSYQ